MNLFQTLIFSLGLSLAVTSNATAKHTHLGTPAQQKAAIEWNRTHLAVQSDTSNWSPLKPFSETENTGFVALSGDNDMELPGLREAIAKNLPTGVTLVIYVGQASQVPALKSAYGQYLDDSRLKFVVVTEQSDSDPIWARDSLPYPVHMQPGGKSAFGLVDSIYPQDFEPDAQISSALSLPMISTGLQFRGGNMLIDADSNCFSENVNEVAALPDPQSFFSKYFGCASITLLPQQGGIGDIDERLKFMSGKDILTDNDAYASQLQSKGYVVHRIPSTGNDGETYMNTLLVNGTIFVPQMGIPADAEALTAYRALGLNAVGVYTKTLADEGLGNIHCVTMNYPPGTFTASPLGADFVQFTAR